MPSVVKPRIQGLVAMAVLMAGFSAAAAYSSPSTDPMDNPSIMSPRSFHLMSAKIAKAGKRLVSVGERGTILLSDDNGQTWRQVPCPVRITLTAVTFADADHGWAVGHGGIVLTTEDGGNSWSKQLDGTAAAKIELDQAQAELAGSADQDRAKRRVREAEGLVADGPDKPFLDVHFFDADHGMVVGAYGLAFVTADGGKSWSSIMGRFADQRGRHLYAVDDTPKGLFIAGEQGTVYKSDDHGQSFQVVRTPGRGTYFGMISDRQGDIVAYGLRGALYRSADGGGNWEKVSLTNASLTAGRCLDDGTLVIADETGQVFRSTDGGKSFAPFTQTGGGGISGVTQADNGALIAAGPRGNVRLALADGQSEGNDK